MLWCLIQDTSVLRTRWFSLSSLQIPISFEIFSVLLLNPNPQFSICQLASGRRAEPYPFCFFGSALVAVGFARDCGVCSWMQPFSVPALKLRLWLQVHLPLRTRRCPCFVSLSILQNLPSPLVLANTSLSTSSAFCIYRCLTLQRSGCPWEAITSLDIWKSASSFNQAVLERHGWIYSI